AQHSTAKGPAVEPVSGSLTRPAWQDNCRQDLMYDVRPPRRASKDVGPSGYLQPPQQMPSRSNSPMASSHSPDGRSPPTSCGGQSTSRSPRGSLSGMEEDDSSPLQSPLEALPGTWGTVERTFRAFCGLRQEGMDGKTFAKLCKDCDLVDKNLTATGLDIVFAKVVQKGQRRIGLEEFDSALPLLAERKCVSVDEICGLIRRSGGPVLNSTK
ncbi:unnamed protein product, partial [Polarella glacialis]